MVDSHGLQFLSVMAFVTWAWSDRAVVKNGGFVFYFDFLIFNFNFFGTYISLFPRSRLALLDSSGYFLATHNILPNIFLVRPMQLHKPN